MQRKLLAIFLLAAGLAALLIVRPWSKEEIPPPRFFDRLPDADIIGKSNILELSRSLSSTMYFYKIPIREFLSHDFILGQGKTYGIDLQKPVFFFADQKDWEIDDFGIMTILGDSSKVKFGIDKLKQVLDMKDTLVLNSKVVKNEQYNFYLTYGDDWLFAYQGVHFKKRLRGILNAKRNEIPPKWREFLNSPDYNNTNAVAYLNFDDLKEHGIESSVVSVKNDSSSLYLSTTINQIDTLKFSLKNTGPSYGSQEFTKYLINLHCNTENLTFEESDPLFDIANRYIKRVNFPKETLLKAWTGDISYRQGGIQEVDEKYIESVLDENFNVQEVVKIKKVKVPSFSLFLSINEHGDELINKLFAKGILTNDGSKKRLLFSPPMNMKKTDSTLLFHTGKYIPAMEQDSINEILWTNNYTPYRLRIDSTSVKSIYSTIQIPLERILKNNLPVKK